MLHTPIHGVTRYCAELFLDVARHYGLDKYRRRSPHSRTSTLLPSLIRVEGSPQDLQAIRFDTTGEDPSSSEHEGLVYGYEQGSEVARVLRYWHYFPLDIRHARWIRQTVAIEHGEDHGLTNVFKSLVSNHEALVGRNQARLNHPYPHQIDFSHQEVAYLGTLFLQILNGQMTPREEAEERKGLEAL